MYRPPRWMVATFALGLLALGGAGAWFYLAQRQYLQRVASANLLAVAQAKLDQIAAWRTERLADAAVLQESPFFVRAVARWLEGRQPEIAADILTRLRSTKSHYRYDDVRLVDRAGRTLLATRGFAGGFDQAEAGALRVALRDRRPVIGDVFDSADDSIPRLAVVAPLFALSARAAEPLGAVVHVVDAQRSLFHFVVSWAGPSPSAEAVLVRRDGDSVLLLTARRFQPRPSLPRRVSLSRRDVPAVMAVLGTQGVVRGVDYRDVKVISALRAVPGTPWFLVVKVDEAEALAVWRTEAALVFAALLGLALVAVATAIAVGQRSATAHYRRLYEAEAALSASEEVLRATFEQAAVGIARVALDGRWLLVNDRLCEIVGCSREELLAKSFQDITQSDDLADDMPYLRPMLKNEMQTYRREQKHIRQDKSIVWVDLTVSLVRDQAGAPQYFVGIIEDITERKVAEEALRSRESMLQRIFDILPVGLWFADKDGKLLRGNAAGVKIWGAEPRVALSDYGIFKARRLPSGKEVAPDDWALTHTIRNRETIVDELLEIDAFDGRKKTILNYTAPVLDAQGEVQGAIVVNQDITELKRAEETLRASDQHLREAQRVARVGSWEFNLTTGSVTWSEELYRMVGRDPGRPAPSYEELHRYYTPESWARLRIAVEGAMATGAPFHLDLEVIREDGTRWWQSARGEAIRSTGGTIDRLHGTVLDITERKHAEATLRALAGHLEAVREEEHTLIAREIHDELGQALTALRLDLVWLGRKLPEGSTALRGRLDGAVQLTDEMITVGQRIAGNLRPPILDDLGLVPAVEWYTQQFAERSGLRIELDIGGEGPVVTDRLAVTAYRIVQEALTNVARHARATHVRVRLGEQDGALTLEISDDGQGFREEAAGDPRSFGLVGMRERAASHGGELAIASSPGAGTTVRATFPRGLAPH